jgi:sulfoacetaldehyde acetyltransferase
VLALGSRLGPFGTLPQHGIDYWPVEAQVVQVDTDTRMLGLVKPIAVGICGDAGLAAEAVLARLRVLTPAPARDEARVATIADEKAAWAAELAGLATPSATGRISPRAALTELARAMPADAVVSTDIGNVCSTANSYLAFDRPQSFLAAMSWGNCGYAFPAAIGAKVARPDRPAIAYVGEGAWGMSLTETMTCVREQIPVVAIVFDNRQWGAERRNQLDFFDGRTVATNLENPDFSAVARAMGAEGTLVEEVDQIGDALRSAVASNRPTVLTLRLNQELADPFRRDAFKPTPTRLLEKYRSLSG